MSLVELLVAVAMGLVVMAGVLGMVASSLRANSDSVKTTRLNQEMRAALDLMVRDIRRAGYHRNYTANIGSLDTSAANRVLDNTVRITENGGVIQFQYDLDDDGPQGAANERYESATESFGFRLRSGVIQYTTDGGTTWNPLTDPQVLNITELSFCFWPGTTACPTEVSTESRTVLNGSTANVSVVTVLITMEGQLRGDPTIRFRLRENVRVRNDRFDNLP